MFDYILKNKYKHIKKIYSKEKILTIAPGAIIPITFQVETVDFGAEERSCKVDLRDSFSIVVDSTSCQFSTSATEFSAESQVLILYTHYESF
ncbi:hypothetical protein KC19_10G105400 [Ceratodon purpureus]|uniref:Uncharacterized protein n=1 Tax=Ceratodon purpureus TaxID=3225 RepID=A0A8T0GLK9_CERPU|nr:hypothetical protein KC19_10G105400 [Ceratodon purpureus]